MQAISLNYGQSQRLTPGGAMLHVVNDPLLTLPRLNESLALYLGRLAGATLIAGFDRTPTSDSYDAVVPPFMEACFAVPDTVSALYVLFVVDSFVETNPGALPVLVEWIACAGSPFLRQIQHGHTNNNPNEIMPTDQHGGFWQPIPQTVVLDQQMAGSTSPAHLRPKIAPSVVDTIHKVTAANTLFPFTGGQGVLSLGVQVHPADTKWNVCHRIIVSVSAACLFVVGGPGLSVGSTDYTELGRITFAAAGTQVLEYGEGIEIRQSAFAGAWQAYTSAIVTLDATVIAG